MKNLIFVLFIILFSSCTNNGFLECIPENLRDSIIAFYPFDNGSLLDQSGNNYNLTNIGNARAVEDRVGNQRCAYSFNGTLSQFLSRNGSFTDDFQTSNFSISLWYRPTSGKNDRQILVARGIDNRKVCGATLEQWFVILQDCERPYFTVNNTSRWSEFPALWSDTTIQNKCMKEIEFYADQWHHLVVVFDRGNLEVYLNGVLSPELIVKFNCVSDSQNIGDLFIGKNFFGEMDDIIIFNRSLSAADVKDLFDSEPCCN